MREYLKKIREKKSLTQTNTAKMLGCSQQFYNQIEAGERQQDMNISLVFKLARVFNISAEEIIAEEQKLII